VKHQYFGDVNDYRKYGLLRALTRVSGLRIGVCWLLTPDDAGGDGELRRYLAQPSKWRRYDSELYDALRRLLQEGLDRSVRHAREWDLVPGAEYFEPILADLAPARQEYFCKAWERLACCELLFLDPDNGIEVSSAPWAGRGSSRYIYWRELKVAFSRGHSLLIYQHYPHVPREPFVPFLADRIAEELGCSRVTAFRTSHVAFFLAQQPAHFQALDGAAIAIAAQWPRQIEPWPEASSTSQLRSRPFRAS
jgi:hypothetical protein